MPGVKKSIYRQPITPGGLKKIEKGELQWFDIEMFANFNTGTLEQYLDEKNKIHSFARSKFLWKRVAIGIMVGCAFALINQYIGLKIGLITSGAWYLTYILGMALGWSPTEMNICSGAASGTDRTATGFVFTFPAIFLLAYDARYFGADGNPLVDPSDISGILPIALVASLFGALLGLMYFLIFRRIWLVDDPLPYPAFETSVKLMDIANDISSGARDKARHAVKMVFGTTALVALFSILRDFPLVRHKVYADPSATGKVSLMDHLFGRRLIGDPDSMFSRGEVHMSANQSTYTHLGYSFSLVGIGIGWFMRAKVAFLVCVGSLLTWFVVVPMIVYFDVPLFIAIPQEGIFTVHARDLPILVVEDGVTKYAGGVHYAAEAAYSSGAKIIAIGTILGGGITALIKMLPVFRTVFGDVRKAREGGKRSDWIENRGWYEWPLTHIQIVMILTFIGVFIAFAAGGFPIIASLIFALVLVFVTFLFGAIAVKVAGEIGTTPVSGTSFLTFLLLFVVFIMLHAVVPFPNGKSEILVMALLGTAVFGSSISLSSEIIVDFKIGIYCGTRPFHLMRAETTGILFGTIISVSGAVMFSTLLAKGQLDLAAPQANAFAGFAQMLAGGRALYTLFFLGVMIGVFIELMTGMGTAFGLGMYLPMAFSFTFLVGGVARDAWEKYWLEPKAKRENLSEKDRTFFQLNTYMIATGFLVGEAIAGVVIAFWLIGGS